VSAILEDIGDTLVERATLDGGISPVIAPLDVDDDDITALEEEINTASGDVLEAIVGRDIPRAALRDESLETMETLRALLSEVLGRGNKGRIGKWASLLAARASTGAKGGPLEMCVKQAGGGLVS